MRPVISRGCGHAAGHTAPQQHSIPIIRSRPSFSSICCEECNCRTSALHSSAMLQSVTSPVCQPVKLLRRFGQPWNGLAMGRSQRRPAGRGALACGSNIGPVWAFSLCSRASFLYASENANPIIKLIIRQLSSLECRDGPDNDGMPKRGGGGFCYEVRRNAEMMV